MTRTRRNAVTACVIATATLLASGCTPDEPVAEPTTSAPPSTSPSPSPSPEPVVVAPERPAAMDDDGPAGAEAAARYFLALDSYVQATGNTQEWDAMSHATCEYCANRSEQARQIAENDDRYEGGEITAAIRHTYAQDGATGIWPLDVEVSENASTIRSPEGNVVFTNGASSYQVRVEVARRGGQWVAVTVADKPES